MYNPNAVTHQNIQAAAMLKTGMSVAEAQKTMGAEPIRLDTEGNADVWQYCDTQYDQSNYVALFFSKNANLLDKINYYTISWREAKGFYLVDHTPFNTEEKQVDCHFFAQKMGIKIPSKIEITVTNGDLDKAKDIRRQEIDAIRSYQYAPGAPVIGPRSPDGHCCR